MVKEILDKAIAKLLGRAICGLPKELSDEIFWVIYQQWFRHHTGPLLNFWKGHDCATDFMNFAEEIGWEWSVFTSASVVEITQRTAEVFHFRKKTTRA